ncbi:MAG: SDR family NAD(P)-dependent oxidoreductase [Tannerellaceae bacterium]
MEKGLAIITGADGGMGQEITAAMAREGFSIIMACKDPIKAQSVCDRIRCESGNEQIEVRGIDLAALATVRAFAGQLLAEGRTISHLFNNAGVLTSSERQTVDGLETLVSVNYVAPYLLTLSLLPLMQAGTRIINTVSCTYSIGSIESCFFTHGKSGRFQRIPVYANTKLALLLFTRELAKRLEERAITVNATDPGIVSTRMVYMNAWFDPLTDIFFRPFIKTAAQGAATAIHLALSDEVASRTGCCFANCREKKLADNILHHPAQKKLWADTEKIINQK